MTGHTYYSQMVVISNIYIYIYDHTSYHSHCLGGYCQLYPKYIKMDQVIIWQSWLSLILQYMTVPETYPNGSLVMTTIDKFRPVIVSPILLQSCPKRWIAEQKPTRQCLEATIRTTKIIATIIIYWNNYSIYCIYNVVPPSYKLFYKSH